MVVKAVLFDWNQTLLGDEHIACGSMAEIFRNFGLEPPSYSQYLKEISSNWMEFYVKYGIPNDPKTVNGIRTRYYREHDRELKIRDYAKKTILNLSLMKIKTGIVSGEVEALLNEKLIQNGLLSLLDVVRGGVYGDKTSALIEVCADINIQPSQAIYIDDTFDGVSAASKAGMIPVGFSNGYNSPEHLRMVAGGDNVVSNFKDLFRLVEKLNRAER